MVVWAWTYFIFAEWKWFSTVQFLSAIKHRLLSGEDPGCVGINHGLHDLSDHKHTLISNKSDH